MPTSYVEADLTNVENAIKSGVLTVRFSDGKSVTYRSLDELLKIRDDIQKGLGTAPKTQRIFPKFSKGIV